MNDSPIILEDENSWPDEVLTAFQSALASLEGYHLFDREVDRQYEETGNILLKCSPPRNPHRKLRERCLATIEVKLQEHSMVGYHLSFPPKTGRSDYAACG